MREPDWGLDPGKKARDQAMLEAMDAEAPDFMIPPDPAMLKGNQLHGQ